MNIDSSTKYLHVPLLQSSVDDSPTIKINIADVNTTSDINKLFIVALFSCQPHRSSKVFEMDPKLGHIAYFISNHTRPL